MPLLTSRGQVTVPAPIRRQLGWKAGDTLIFDLRSGVVTVRKAPVVDDLAGIVQALIRAEGGNATTQPAARAWADLREKAWHAATWRFGEGKR